MKRIFFVLALLGQSALSWASSEAFLQSSYPSVPDPKMTPGSLCARADSRRYPEQIAYCERRVGSSLKQKIIETYDSTFGFSIEAMKRSAFKIDHHIPLCMGGSNEMNNLWPQHESVFRFTDPLEQATCQKMAEGKLTQAAAVELIRKVKQNPQEAPSALERVRKL